MLGIQFGVSVTHFLDPDGPPTCLLFETALTADLGRGRRLPRDGKSG
jgi:hypothetical protein